MIHPFLLILGLLVSSMPGPGVLALHSPAVHSPRASLPSTTMLQSASPHRLPSPATSKETCFSDPEEKEEDSDLFFGGGRIRPGDPFSATGRPDHRSVNPAPGHGLLHRLPHPWQLQC